MKSQTEASRARAIARRGLVATSSGIGGLLAGVAGHGLRVGAVAGAQRSL